MLEFKSCFATFIDWYFTLGIAFFILANTSYLIVLILGYFNARRKYIEKKSEILQRLSSLRGLRPISILVPCYNEEASIEESVLSMLQLSYPEFEIIVCNDGSKDRTLEVLISRFDLMPSLLKPPSVLPSAKIRQVYVSGRYSNLIVLNKENGGKADALNAAINFSKFPLICCVDADSLLDSDGLARVSMPFLEDPDNTIASGGSVMVVNTNEFNSGSKQEATRSIPWGWFGMIQSMEYLRSFLVGRLGWSAIKCDLVISGAFGLFRKSLVIKVGGYRKNTIGEDMELIVRMQSYCRRHRVPHSVHILPDPVCWTEAPSDLKTLGNQRTRWTQGLIESIWLHRDMIFKPWAGRLGFIALPYYFFFELLSAPIEVIGYLILPIGIALDLMDYRVALLFLCVTIAYGAILNLGAVIIDQLTFRKFGSTSDALKLILGSTLEHFGFRQLHLYWRMRGIYRWLVGKQSWGEMQRKGLKISASS
jgi:cellulose synthase/poly-beta-1,6-N-acetylglucosamine synthase-like glycosyltransferase